MNPVIENDILHVSRIMRASIFQCAPHVMLPDYWHARLSLLLEEPGLLEMQRCTVMGLLRELADIEGHLAAARTGTADAGLLAVAQR